MPVRRATAVWEDNLANGKGKMKTQSGTFEGAYSFGSRFEEQKGTNPEELLGAAHAGCFSMALAHAVDQAGFKPKRVFTTASVHLVKEGDGFIISEISLKTEADIPGIDKDQFMKFAEETKANCPVSKALAGPKITLEAVLNS